LAIHRLSVSETEDISNGYADTPASLWAGSADWLATGNAILARLNVKMMQDHILF
jgi:hypothetical protein